MRAVQLGMEVRDQAGELVGQVDDLKFGDPAAATEEGQTSGTGNGLLAEFARAFDGGSDLHPQAAARLLRVGYIRVDREGLLSGHAYAAADDIADVTGGTVRLAIPSSQLHSG